jgi:membrane-associated protein
VTYAGSILGGVQFVHDNLSMLILLIVFVSLLPMVAQAIVARRKAGKAPSPAGAGSADRDTDEGAPADAPAAD